MIQKNSITCGIFAHVDAGKTTLSESILSLAGVIECPGSVDAGSTHLDSQEIERERGITIFSGQAVFPWRNRFFYILDTPGHRDFYGEAERAFQVIDCAVILVSGTEGVKGNVFRFWDDLKRHNIPVIFFVNKSDMDDYDPETSNEIRELLSADAVDFPENFADLLFQKEGCEKYRDFYEQAAFASEAALNEFIENGFISKERISSLIMSRKLFPVFKGSALEMTGISDLLDGLSLFEAKRNSEKFGGRVFSIFRDDEGTRLTFTKVTGGEIHTKDEIDGERIKEIRIYSGMDYKIVSTASAGDLCALVGPENTYSGQGLGREKSRKSTISKGAVSYRISSLNGLGLSEALRQLSEEFPELNIRRTGRGDFLLDISGEVQKETLLSLLKKRFSVTATVSKPLINYRETVKKKGCDRIYTGLPEPMPYLTVTVLPLPPDSGTEISVNCREEQVSSEIQNQIEMILRRRFLYGEISGILTGYPIVDVKIEITSGRGKIRNIAAGDFQEALAFGIERAFYLAEPVPSEPFCNYRIEMAPEYTGRITAALQKRRGTILTQESRGRNQLIEGELPMAIIGEFNRILSEITGGTGVLTTEPGGYGVMRDPERIKKISFLNRDRISMLFDLVPRIREEEKEDPNSFYAGKNELDAIFEMTYGKKKRPAKEKRIVRGKNEDGNYKGKERKWKPGEPMRLLVDGYNIIFSWPELNDLSKTDIGAARDSLVEILANYAGYTGEKVVVVFDAYKRDGKTATSGTISGVKVIYTAKDMTADSFIEKTVHDNIDSYPITVATSDRLEQMNVFSSGAMRLSARDLADRVKRVTGKSRCE